MLMDMTEGFELEVRDALSQDGDGAGGRRMLHNKDGTLQEIGVAVLKCGLQHGPLAHDSTVRVAVLVAPHPATTRSSGRIRRLRAALRTREERPITPGPTERPCPWSQAAPKTPISPRQLATRG